MNIEPSSFAETWEKRKESARRTLRDVSIEELHALVHKLFPDGTHPFAETVSHFIEEHRGERALHGETSDRISFIYYPQSDKGLWYQYTSVLPSVGVLGPIGLKTLKEIVAEKGRV